MSVVIIEQEFSAPLTAQNILNPSDQTLSCMEIYGARARRHYFSHTGLNCVCVFEAPDAEAIRSAFRLAGPYTPKDIWAASIHVGDGTDPDRPPVLRNPDFVIALVERSFADPADYAQVRAAEETGACSKDLRGVRFLRSYLSSSRKRMVCLYEAPDVEAVRTVNRHAGLPFERAWAVEILTH